MGHQLPGISTREHVMMNKSPDKVLGYAEPYTPRHPAHVWVCVTSHIDIKLAKQKSLFTDPLLWCHYNPHMLLSLHFILATAVPTCSCPYTLSMHVTVFWLSLPSSPSGIPPLLSISQKSLSLAKNGLIFRGYWLLHCALFAVSLTSFGSWKKFLVSLHLTSSGRPHDKILLFLNKTRRTVKCFLHALWCYNCSLLMYYLPRISVSNSSFTSVTI